MGKLNMDLLKGIEQQENIIDESKAKEKPEIVQKPQKDTEKRQTVKNTLDEKKSENKANTKLQRQSFSFRADPAKIENWKLYAEAIGVKDLGALWSAAIEEYIENHSLTADQQVVYNLRRRANETQKKIKKAQGKL